jgi:hypothetical protein
MLALVACQKASEQAITSGEFKVEKLFTHEGCTVYRFYDDRTVYYTNCNGSTQSSHSCGKGCTHIDNVTTENKQ